MYEEGVIKILKDISIEDMDFSVRSYNCLYNSYNRTLYDIINHSINEISMIKNIGKKSLGEIVYKVHFLGLQFKDEEKNDINLGKLYEFYKIKIEYENLVKNGLSKR